MIRILIADDHIYIREGIKKIINNEMDMQIVGEAQTASETLYFLSKNKCDIVILDLSLPDRSGLEILKDIKENYPDVKVMILSVHSEKLYAIRAFKGGASGYLTKESPPEELTNALRKLADGRKYITEAFAEVIAQNINSDKDKKTHELLSDREFQIFRLIALGKPIKEIANELNLSQSTINTYRLRIFDKMNMKSNIELIYYAIRNELINKT